MNNLQITILLIEITKGNELMNNIIPSKLNKQIYNK